MAYRIRTPLTVKKRTTAFFRERSALANHGSGGFGYQGNNNSFQRLRYQNQRQLSNNKNNATNTKNNDVVDASAIEMKISDNTSAKYPQKLFQNSGIFPLRGSCGEEGGERTIGIEGSECIGSTIGAEMTFKKHKGKRRLSLNIRNLSNDSQSSLNSNNNNNNGNRRQSLFERRKSTSSLDDALDECSRRFSEPNVDLNPELIASCLSTLESLYESAAHGDKKSTVSSLFRQALRRFSAVSQHQKQQPASASRGSCSSSLGRHSQDLTTFESLTSTHGDMSPTSASTSAPFPHVIHKLNQNKENVD